MQMLGKTCQLLLLLAAAAIQRSLAQAADQACNTTSRGAASVECLYAEAEAIQILAGMNTSETWNTTTISGVVEGMLSTCLGVSAALQPINVVAPKEADAILNDVFRSFTKDNGVVVNLVPVPFASMNDEILFALRKDALKGQYNAFHFELSGIVDIYDAGGLLDLRPYLDTTTNYKDNGLDWKDILEFYRNSAAVYNDKVACLPEAALLPYVYYRRDLLSPFRTPSTWPELIELARKVNDSDFNGDGRRDFAVCMEMEPIRVGFVLFNMLSAMTQYAGLSQGFLIDPPTMTFLMDTPAGRQALKWYQELYSFSTGSRSNPSYTPYFGAGDCAIMISWAEVFKLSVYYPFKGNMVITPWPGSDIVYDRSSKQLVPCTSSLCRMSKARDDGSTMYYNRVDFGSYIISGGVNPMANSSFYRISFDVMSYSLSSSLINSSQIFTPQNTFGPLRKSHMDVTSWMTSGAGYIRADVDQFLAATQSMLDNANVVVSLRIKNSMKYVDLANEAALMVINGGKSPPVAANITQQKMMQLFAGSGDQAVVQRQYLVGIGYTGPTLIGDGGGDSSYQWSLAVAIAVPIVVVLVLGCLAMLAVAFIRSNRHKTLFGRIKAPEAGPEVSLVITDIESSTTLWETLSPDVMDLVIKLHHTTVRMTAAKHCGYESGTEGDSFILAFHKANDAVMFAVECQEALLAVPWPADLLELDMCKPLWVIPIDRHQLSQNVATKADSEAGRQAPRRLASFFIKTPSSKQPPSGTEHTASPPQGASGVLPVPSGATGAHALSHGMFGKLGSTAAGALLNLMHSHQVDRDSGPSERMFFGSRRPTSASIGLSLNTIHATSTMTNPGGISGAADGMEAGVRNSDASAHLNFQTEFHPTGVPPTVPEMSDSVQLAPAADASGRSPSGPPGRVTPNSATARAHVAIDVAAPSFSTLVPAAQPAAEDGEEVRPGEHGTGSYPEPATQADVDPLVARSARSAFMLAPAAPGSQSARGLMQIPSATHPGRSSGAFHPLSGPAAAAQDDPDAASRTQLRSYSCGYNAAGSAPEGHALSWGPDVVEVVAHDDGDVEHEGLSERPSYNESASARTERRDASLFTVKSHLESSSRLADGPGPGRILLFNGLRVRMGVHTGADAGDAVYNRTAGRMQYTGAFAEATKLVQDAAHGGMVLLSEATKEQLNMDVLNKAVTVVAHMGEHVLDDGMLASHVYSAFKESLMHRWAYLGPVRSVAQATTGFLAAPYGESAIAFMTVVGLSSLTQWDAGVTRSALEIYRNIAQEEITRYNGYLVESSEGLLLVSFCRPGMAVRWALSTMHRCLEANWPPELLQHEMGEEICIGGGKGPSSGRDKDKEAPPAVAQFIFRGLRLKCGIDFGKVLCSVHGALGRMTYRGKVMNRAARIMGAAKTGQVWTTDDTWVQCVADTGRSPDSFTSAISGGFAGTEISSQPNIRATPLGPYKLKGVRGDLDLVHVHLDLELVLGVAIPGQGVSFTARHSNDRAYAHAKRSSLELVHAAHGNFAFEPTEMVALDGLPEDGTADGAEEVNAQGRGKRAAPVAGRRGRGSSKGLMKVQQAGWSHDSDKDPSIRRVGDAMSASMVAITSPLFASGMHASSAHGRVHTSQSHSSHNSPAGKPVSGQLWVVGNNPEAAPEGSDSEDDDFGPSSLDIMAPLAVTRAANTKGKGGVPKPQGAASSIWQKLNAKQKLPTMQEDHAGPSTGMQRQSTGGQASYAPSNGQPLGSERGSLPSMFSQARTPNTSTQSQKDLQEGGFPAFGRQLPSKQSSPNTSDESKKRLRRGNFPSFALRQPGSKQSSRNTSDESVDKQRAVAPVFGKAV